MTGLESLLGDFVTMLTQHGLARWGVALAASLWVWMIGDEDARLRKLYLLAPFAIAGLAELAALMPSRPGGGLSQLILVQDMARKIGSPVGFGGMLVALVLGYMRGIGFAFGVAVLLSVYFGDGLQWRGMGGGELVAMQGFTLAATITTVLLTAYGLGATFRKLRERRRDDA